MKPPIYGGWVDFFKFDFLLTFSKEKGSRVLALFPLEKINMKRLSLEELKAQKNVVANLETIKGGDETAYFEKNGIIYWYISTPDSFIPVRSEPGYLC